MGNVQKRKKELENMDVRDLIEIYHIADKLRFNKSSKSFVIKTILDGGVGKLEFVEILKLYDSTESEEDRSYIRSTFHGKYRPSNMFWIIDLYRGFNGTHNSVKFYSDIKQDERDKWSMLKNMTDVLYDNNALLDTFKKICNMTMCSYEALEKFLNFRCKMEFIYQKFKSLSNDTKVYDNDIAYLKRALYGREKNNSCEDFNIPMIDYFVSSRYDKIIKLRKKNMKGMKEQHNEDIIVRIQCILSDNPLLFKGPFGSLEIKFGDLGYLLKC